MDLMKIRDFRIFGIKRKEVKEMVVNKLEELIDSLKNANAPQSLQLAHKMRNKILSHTISTE